MEDYKKPFDTCEGACDYAALKAKNYFLQMENKKLKDSVARLMIRCIDMENAEDKLLRIKLYLEEVENANADDKK
jgi:hypothetical protein